MKRYYNQKELIEKFGPALKLDIGCGKNKRPGFIGVDINEESQADVICSALELPLQDSSVSEISCSHLVEHFNPGQAQKFFNEICRVLKPAGRAWLKIDRDWSEKRLLKKDLEHKKRYSVEDIKGMVKDFGFSKVERKIYRYEWHLRNKIFVELRK